MHTTEKKFACSECGKLFRRRDNLGKQVVSCSFLIELASHMRIHTRETPFECSVCNKKFRHQSAFINHRRTHQTTTLFPCQLCSFVFTKSGSLEKHMQKDHKILIWPGRKCDIQLIHTCLIITELLIHPGEKQTESTGACGSPYVSPRISVPAVNWVVRRASCKPLAVKRKGGYQRALSLPLRAIEMLEAKPYSQMKIEQCCNPWSIERMR